MWLVYEIPRTSSEPYVYESKQQVYEAFHYYYIDNNNDDNRYYDFRIEHENNNYIVITVKDRYFDDGYLITEDEYENGIITIIAIEIE